MSLRTQLKKIKVLGERQRILKRRLRRLRQDGHVTAAQQKRLDDLFRAWRSSVYKLWAMGRCAPYGES